MCDDGGPLPFASTDVSLGLTWDGLAFWSLRKMHLICVAFLFAEEPFSLLPYWIDFFPLEASVISAAQGGLLP